MTHYPDQVLIFLLLTIIEAKYVIVYERVKEDVWLRKFLIDLEVVPNMAQSFILYCDINKEVFNSKEPRSQKRGNILSTIII